MSALKFGQADVLGSMLMGIDEYIMDIRSAKRITR